MNGLPGQYYSGQYGQVRAVPFPGYSNRSWDVPVNTVFDMEVSTGSILEIHCGCLHVWKWLVSIRDNFCLQFINELQVSLYDVVSHKTFMENRQLAFFFWWNRSPLGELSVLRWRSVDHWPVVNICNGSVWPTSYITESTLFFYCGNIWSR